MKCQLLGVFVISDAGNKTVGTKLSLVNIFIRTHNVTFQILLIPLIVLGGHRSLFGLATSCTKFAS